MYRLVFLISVLSMVMLTGCISDSGEKKPVIGVIDAERVYSDSNAGKEGVKYLEKIHADMQVQLNKIQEESKMNPENKEIVQRIQEVYEVLSARIEAEQQNVITLLNNSAQRVLDEYRVNNNMLILVSSEATLSYDAKIDVTADIIAALNKEKIDFKLSSAGVPPSNMGEAKKEAVDEKAPAKKEAADEKAPAKKEAVKEKAPVKKDSAKADAKEKAKQE